MKITMHCLGRCLMVAALLMECSGAVRARTYYVQVDGSDSGEGTQSDPWRTIGWAMRRMGPGDTMLIGPGIFPERILSRVHGRPDAPIIIEGSPGTKTLGVSLQHGYHTIRGLDISGDCAPKYGAAFLIGAGGHGSRIEGNHIHDLGPAISSISWLPGGAEPESSAGFCLVRSNFLYNLRANAISAVFGYSNIIAGNIISNSLGSVDVVRIWGRENKFTSNEIRNIKEGSEGGGHPDIIQIFTSAASYWHSYSNYFEANFVADCNSQLCMLENDNAQGSSLRVGDLTFRNNVFVNIKYGGQVLIPGTKWHNNIFYRCATNTLSAPFLLSGYSGRPWNSGHSADIRNNIFALCGVNASDATKGWYVIAYPKLCTNVVADFNFVTGAMWAPKSGFAERNGINGGNPGFVLEPYELQLTPDSPARGRGQYLVGFDRDFLGRPRQGPPSWDIGAYRIRASWEVDGTKDRPPKAPTGLRIEDAR